MYNIVYNMGYNIVALYSQRVLATNKAINIDVIVTKRIPGYLYDIVESCCIQLQKL